MIVVVFFKDGHSGLVVAPGVFAREPSFLAGTSLAFHFLMRQLSLIPRKTYKKRKTARAIATRRGNQNHVVLSAARPILRRHRVIVLRSIRETQERFGMRIRALAVMEDHLHLLIQVDRRAQFADSLRMLAGTIARRILKKGKLWRQRAWSRIATYGRDLKRATLYVARNPLAAGVDLDPYFLLDGVLQL